MKAIGLRFMNGIDEVAHEQWCPDDYRTDAAMRALRRIRRKVLWDAVARVASRCIRGLGGWKPNGHDRNTWTVRTPTGTSTVYAPDGAMESFSVSLSDIRGVYDPNGTVRDGLALPRHLHQAIWRRAYFGEIQPASVPRVLRVGNDYYIENNPRTLLSIAALRARDVPTVVVRPLSAGAGGSADSPIAITECNWSMSTGQRINPAQRCEGC